jgi:hypothetical protein
MAIRLFFVMFDSPFFWVRAGALRHPVSATLGIEADAVFETCRVEPGAVPVFNRFSRSRVFRTLLNVCRRRDIPYVFDIDDLFWNLPAHSTDEARPAAAYTADLKPLIEGAALVTTTTSQLAREIEATFNTQGVRVIPNALPPGLENPAGACCIANTDNFKLSGPDLGWFSEGLRTMSKAGVPIHVLGENSALFGSEADLILRAAPRVPYQEYLSHICRGGYRFGIIPVSDDDYSRCKSAIKAVEFLDAGMKVFASDIAPYRDLARDHPHPDLTLVPNTRQAWAAVFDVIVTTTPLEEREQAKHSLELESRTRRKQISGWLLVGKELAPRVPRLAHRRLQNRLRLMQSAHRLKNMIAPSVTEPSDAITTERSRRVHAGRDVYRSSSGPRP